MYSGTLIVINRIASMFLWALLNASYPSLATYIVKQLFSLNLISLFGTYSWPVLLLLLYHLDTHYLLQISGRLFFESHQLVSKLLMSHYNRAFKLTILNIQILRILYLFIFNSYIKDANLFIKILIKKNNIDKEN